MSKKKGHLSDLNRVVIRGEEALIKSEKGHLLEIKKGTCENEKWTLIAKEHGSLWKENWYVSK